jgi:hypothetical protein
VAARRRPHFVLDQDFPESPVLGVPFPDIVFTALRNLHPDLCSAHDDWQVLQQLRARGGVDGFVTLDTAMLHLAREMVVLRQTRLSLVVLQDVNNDPIAAGGLLVAAAARLATEFDARHPQIFRIRAPRIVPESPWEQIAAIASRERTAPEAVERRERLGRAQLLRDDRFR